MRELASNHKEEKQNSKLEENRKIDYKNKMLTGFCKVGFQFKFHQNLVIWEFSRTSLKGKF